MSGFCAMNPKQVFVREATGLVREISTTDSFVWNITYVPLLLSFVNLMFWTMSSGVLNVDYVVTTLVWMIMSGIVMLIYYVMAVAMPRSGGDYVWGTRAVHPAIGFLMSWSFVWVNILVEATGSYAGVTYLSSGLSIVGKMTDDVGLQSLAGTLTEPTSQLVVGMGILVFAALAGCFGKRILKGVIYFILLVGLVGLVVAFGLMLSTTRGAYVTSFNAISGLSYDQVLSQAQAAGYLPIVTVAASLSAIPFAIFALPPPNVTAFLGGEVKTPRRSFLYGMLGAWAIAALIWLGAFTLLDSTIGMRFIEAMTFLSQNNPDVYAQTGMPAATANLFISVITRNPMIIHLVTLSIFIGNMGWMVILFAVNARIFLAWAFDRLAPSQLSQVSERFLTPIYSVLLMAVLCIGGFIILFYNPAAFTFNVALLISFWLCLAGLTALILPYRRKDIFESSPLKGRLAGIPLLSILGFLTVVLYLYMMYVALVNPSLGPISPAALSATVGLVVAGLVIFYLVRAVRKSQGIDIDAVFREIPPE